MTRPLLLVLALAACSPAKEKPDDTLMPVDTFKPAPAADTLATNIDSAAAKAAATKTKTASPPATTRAKTSAKLGRDSAFPPPKLPQLDTVRKKPPL